MQTLRRIFPAPCHPVPHPRAMRNRTRLAPPKHFRKTLCALAALSLAAVADTPPPSPLPEGLTKPAAAAPEPGRTQPQAAPPATPAAPQPPVRYPKVEELRANRDKSEPMDEALGGKTQKGTPVTPRTAECFPAESRDLFWQMDMVPGANGVLHPLNFDANGDGVIDPAERNAIRGRNTWLLWGGGNEGFWNWLGQDGYGLNDYLIALDSRSLGFVEAFAGNNAAAAAHFRRALDITDHMGLGEPAIMRLHPDAVATLVLLGRAHDAMRLVDELDQSARDHGLPWASAMALRCHALVHASEGNVLGALSALEEAMTHHARLPMPFEMARTQLLYGTVLRRAGHRNDARAALDNAHSTFVRLRTPVQAALAVSALGSLGGRPTALPQLTAVEARVATVVADGLTNREAADALFISVRTVESHLASIYRKLGIRSRSELAGLRQQLAAVTPPS